VKSQFGRQKKQLGLGCAFMNLCGIYAGLRDICVPLNLKQTLIQKP
jgi:hypothetical protein